MPADTPDPLTDEIKQLARSLGRLGPSDPLFAEVAEQVQVFQGREQMARSLHRVDHLLQTDVVAIEKRLQERIQKAKETLRDELRRLLEAGRRQGKLS